MPNVGIELSPSLLTPRIGGSAVLDLLQHLAKSLIVTGSFPFPKI